MNRPSQKRRLIGIVLPFCSHKRQPEKRYFEIMFLQQFSRCIKFSRVERPRIHCVKRGSFAIRAGHFEIHVLRTGSSMISKNFSWLIPMTYPPQSTVTPASMFEHVMMKMPCCEAIRTNLMQSCFNQVEYSNLSNLDKRNLRGNRNSILRKGGAVRLAAAFLLFLTVNMHAQTNAPDSSTVLNHIIGDSLQNRAGESAPATPESQTLLLDANPAPDTAGLSGLADHSGNRSRTEKKLVDHKHLEIEYSTGLAARQRQHWTYAALVFERILDNDPNFRDTRAQLTEVEAYLKQMSTDSVLAGFYDEALYAMDRVDLGMAP